MSQLIAAVFKISMKVTTSYPLAIFGQSAIMSIKVLYQFSQRTRKHRDKLACKTCVAHKLIRKPQIYYLICLFDLLGWLGILYHAKDYSKASYQASRYTPLITPGYELSLFRREPFQRQLPTGKHIHGGDIRKPCLHERDAVGENVARYGITNRATGFCSNLEQS
jgi:hypothetical protein